MQIPSASRYMFHQALLTAILIIATYTTATAQTPNPGSHDRYHAVLIGVSNYPDKKLEGVNENRATKEMRLDGPKSDVEFTYRMLTGLKRNGRQLYHAQDIVVVADSLPESFRKQLSDDGATLVAEPTDANIRAALDGLVGRLKASPGNNDFVYLHMSGHGVQAPASGRDLAIEPDGLDELFLPIDVGEWVQDPDTEEFKLERAISDNDIANYIGELKREAFVWLVFDSCHSGDMVRAASDAAKTRRVEPSIFGRKFADAVANAHGQQDATRSVSRPAREAPIADATRRHGTKRFVAFYAVQSNQLAIEKKLPDSASPSLGLFTYSVVKAIQSLPDASYQEIAEAARAEYDRFGGELRQPLFEGDLRKRSFGGIDGDKKWIAERNGRQLVLKAGELDNITRGSVVALFELGKEGQASALLGHARATNVSLTRSTLRLIAYQGKPAARISALVKRMTVVMQEPNISLELRVAPPPKTDFAKIPADLSTTIQLAMVSARKPSAGDEEIDLRLVGEGDHADLYLRLAPGRICLLRQMGDCGDRNSSNARRPSPSIALVRGMTAEELAGRLHANFYRAAKVFKLMNLYQRSLTRTKKSDIFSEGRLELQITAVHYPHKSDRARDGEQHECRSDFTLFSEGVTSTELKPAKSTADADNGQIVDVIHCDKLEVRARNAGQTPVDLTLLHIDSEFTITPLPTDSNVTVRILPEGQVGGTADEDGYDPFALQFSTWCFEGSDPCPTAARPWSTGIELILAIAVEQPKSGNHIEADFRHLAQAGIDHDDEISTRGVAGEADAACGKDVTARDFCELLQGVQKGLRGAAPVRKRTLDRVALKLYRVNVQPPPRPTN